MQNLYNDLAKILETDDRLFAHGKILKNIVTELAIKLDEKLLKLLLKSSQIKERFFVKIDDVVVFDKDKFMKFVNNKEFLPNSFTTFRNNIGLMSNDEYLKDTDKVVLGWAYKDCVLEGGQDKEDVKRNEIFYNEILAPDEIDRLFEPKVLSNAKRIDKTGECKLDKITEEDNLIIRGNNLLALHSLKKKYRGKVKLIYIDPPYNTGSDSFKYNDSFNHSTWLVFMKNRLEVAKELLRDDGVIFIQCDDNEQAYLGVLLDEIFGKDNYLSSVYIKTVYENKTLKQDRIFHDQIEHIWIYRKSPTTQIEQSFEEYNYDKFVWEVKEINEPRAVLEMGGKKVEVFLKDDFEIKEVSPSNGGLKEIWASGTILDMNSSGRFFRDYLMGRSKEDGHGVLYKVYGIGEDGCDYRYFTGPKKVGATKGKYYQGVPLDKKDDGQEYQQKKSIENFWDMAGDFGNCRTEGGVELKSGKKPEKLLQRIIEMSTKKGDLVLDYHLGSGTTCAVAHKLGRKYIGIEQLDYGENDCLVRLKNVIEGEQSGISKLVDWKGGDSFVSMELKQWNEQYVQAINDAKDSKTLLAVYEKMKKEAFFRYEVDLSKFDNKKFVDLSIDEQKQLLIQCLDKNHLYVNYEDMEDSTYKISTEEKKVNTQFYGS